MDPNQEEFIKRLNEMTERDGAATVTGVADAMEIPWSKGFQIARELVGEGKISLVSGIFAVKEET